MAWTLEQFAARCKEALKADAGPAGRQKVCSLVQEVLHDPEFADRYIPADGPERKVLYEDPELAFTILAHAYQGAKDFAAARSRSVLGDLWSGRRRDNHDGLGMPRPADGKDAGKSEAGSGLHADTRHGVSV